MDWYNRQGSESRAVAATTDIVRYPSHLRRLCAASALTVLLLLIIPTSSFAGAVVANPECSQSALPANDDGSSEQVSVPFVLNFYGQRHSSLYVNNNGNLTFAGPQSTYTPFTISADTPPIIAAFFADVDTRGAGSRVTTYGTTTYGGRTAFCVNWTDVGYFSGHTDKLNSFQLLLVDRGTAGDGAFDIVLNYDKIEWETGDASGGSAGLGGTAAGVGFSNGDGRSDHFYAFPGSLQPGAFLDSNLQTSLVRTRRGDNVPAGRHVFRVSSSGALTPPEDTRYKYVSLGDSYSSGEGAGPFDAGTRTSRNACHRSDNAWPRLLGVTMRAHLACSGAKTRHFYRGKTIGPPDNVGQLARLRGIAAKGRIGRVLVGVGGNDLGFGQIVRDCFYKTCLKRMDEVELPRLENVVRPAVAHTLRDAAGASDGAETVLVGYPDIVPPAGKPIHDCTWLTDPEKPRLRRLEKALDSAMRRAARDAGARYIPIRGALAKHELCTKDSWVRPIGTARVPRQEQGHPDRKGQIAIKRAVQAAL